MLLSARNRLKCNEQSMECIDVASIVYLCSPNIDKDIHTTKASPTRKQTWDWSRYPMNMHEDTYQTKYKNQTNNEIFLLNARYMELETKKIKQRWILKQKYGYWLLLPSCGRGKRVSKDSSFLKCESKIIPHGGRVWRLIEKFFVIFRHGRAFWRLGIDN